MFFWNSLAFSIFSSVAQLCLTLWPHELQHARPPCPLPSPGVHSNSRPLSRWCHPAISSSVIPFSSCPPIPPSIRVFSDESTLCMRWPKYWSFSFSIIPSKEHAGLISFRMDWLLSHIKNEIMPFAATWIDLQIVIVNEARESQTVYDITCM